MNCQSSTATLDSSGYSTLGLTGPSPAAGGNDRWLPDELLSSIAHYITDHRTLKSFREASKRFASIGWPARKHHMYFDQQTRDPWSTRRRLHRYFSPGVTKKGNTTEVLNSTPSVSERLLDDMVYPPDTTIRSIILHGAVAPLFLSSDGFSFEALEHITCYRGSSEGPLGSCRPASHANSTGALVPADKWDEFEEQLKCLSLALRTAKALVGEADSSGDQLYRRNIKIEVVDSPVWAEMGVSAPAPPDSLKRANTRSCTSMDMIYLDFPRVTAAWQASKVHSSEQDVTKAKSQVQHLAFLWDMISTTEDLFGKLIRRPTIITLVGAEEADAGMIQLLSRRMSQLRETTRQRYDRGPRLDESDDDDVFFELQYTAG
jgi:hypothetical protein